VTGVAGTPAEHMHWAKVFTGIFAAKITVNNRGYTLFISTDFFTEYGLLSKL
jgi:hypothetical protein